jgi:hypothetical protein
MAGGPGRAPSPPGRGARIRPDMSDSERAAERQVQSEVAALAGAIERAAGDLALAEEPSNFAAALEAGAPRD